VKRVKARFPSLRAVTERSTGRNCKRISSPTRIKIGIRRFLLLGRAESREYSKTTDRKGHRGDFLGNWELGLELKPKLIIHFVFRCASISTQCRGLPVGLTRFVHARPTTGATQRPSVGSMTSLYYLVDIRGISMDIPCMYTPMDIHGISMDIPCIFHVYW
jgi:hypothetical protein